MKEIHGAFDVEERGLLECQEAWSSVLVLLRPVRA
jgi:hypothetical protein